MQYYDTGWIGVLFTTILVVFILGNIFRAKKNENLYIRRIAGLNAIDEAIGRATEMGRPVLMVPGLGGLNAISMQAINIFAYVTRTAARFANPIRLCCGDAAVYTLAQEVIRDTYQAEGMPEGYDQDSVQFVSDRQFAFAAGVSGIILREQTAATFFMGEFFAESLIFAETANSIGAIQVASSTENTQTPFFIAACDYVLIGDEFYAASAYLTREPVLVGSLIGQDWCKILIGLAVLFGAIGNSLDARLNVQMDLMRRDRSLEPLTPPRTKDPANLIVNRWMSPQKPLPGVEVNRAYASEEQFRTQHAQELGVPELVPDEKTSHLTTVDLYGKYVTEEGRWYTGEIPAASADLEPRQVRSFLVDTGNGFVLRREEIARESMKEEQPKGAEGGS